MESNIFNTINLRIVIVSALIVVIASCATPGETVKSDLPATASEKIAKSTLVDVTNGTTDEVEQKKYHC